MKRRRSIQCAGNAGAALLLILALSVAAPVRAQEAPFCVPTGFRVFVAPEEEDEYRDLDADWYREIPMDMFPRILRDQVDRLRLFEGVTTDSTAAYDLVLAYHIIALRRVALTSEDDLGLDIRLSLEDPRFRQPIWNGEYRSLVEKNSLVSAPVDRQLASRVPRLLASAAVARILPDLAGDLNRFFSRGGLERAAYYMSDSCAARVPLVLFFEGVAAVVRRATLDRFSRTSCFAVRVREGGEFWPSGRGDSIGVHIETVDSETHFLVSAGRTDEYWRAVSGAGGPDLTEQMDELLRVITEYHHRVDICEPERFRRSLVEDLPRPDEEYNPPF